MVLVNLERILVLISENKNSAVTVNVEHVFSILAQYLLQDFLMSSLMAFISSDS